MHRVNNISKLESKIRHYKDIEINDISNEQITNINKIKIDKRKSSVVRILDFLRYVENPYMIKVNETIVKIQFSNKQIKAEECINQVFYNLYLK